MSITETMFYQRQYDDEWPPRKLADFIQWLTIYFEEIPIEHRDTATIEIEEDDHAATITISYRRPKSVTEIEMEQLAIENNQKARQERERAILRELLAKYGES